MDIYTRLSQFKSMKLLLGLGMTLLSTLLYIVMVGLPALASAVLSYFLLPVWAALSLFLCFKLHRSVGYRIDAGQTAIITGAIADGYIPENSFGVSQELLTQRFRTPKSYFQAKKLLSSAVWELNTVFTRASSLIGEVPGMKMMVEIGRQFLRLHLSFMTHACLAYTVFRGDEGLYLSAAEGCAIYAINWKQLCKNAADIAIGFCVALAILTAALGIALFSLMGLIGLGRYAYFGVILALMLLLCIKYAYVDPLFEAFFTHTYMRLAEFSEPSPDFFLRLEKMSPAFAQLTGLANGKFPTPKRTHTFAHLRRRGQARRTPPVQMPDARHTLVCPRCRTANLKNARFCAGCGTQLRR